jgi:hypothetical protein
MTKSLAVDHKESMPAGTGNLRGYEVLRGQVAPILANAALGLETH